MQEEKVEFHFQDVTRIVACYGLFRTSTKGSFVRVPEKGRHLGTISQERWKLIEPNCIYVKSRGGVCSSA